MERQELRRRRLAEQARRYEGCTEVTSMCVQPAQAADAAEQSGETPTLGTRDALLRGNRQGM